MNTDAEVRFVDAATIQERIEDIALLERRLADDPADHLASSHLEAIYRREGSWSHLIQLLLDRAESITSARENAQLLLEVSSIYIDRLREPDAALVVLQTAFANDPTNEWIADAIDRAATATGEWTEVIDNYILTAASLTADHPAVASDLWLRVACINLLTSRDWETVSEALERVIVVDPNRRRSYLDQVESMATTPEILESLALVCARIEDWGRMSRALSRAVAICTDRRYRAKLHQQIAELNRALGDDPTAQWHYVESLRLDPHRSEAREQLILFYKSRGDYRRAAELLEQQRAQAHDDADRAALGYEAAALYRELEENTRALDLCRQTLELDPEHAGAALPLAERYWSEQRWQELEPIADMLIRKRAWREGGWGEVELYYRAGHCAMQLGKPMKAREMYEAGLDRDSVHLASLLECAEVYCQLLEWDHAYEMYNAALIVQRGHNKSNTEFAATLFKMGETRRHAGQLDAALTLYESALDVGDCPGAIEAAIALYDRRGDHHAVVQLKRTLLAVARGPRRVELLSDIAEITSHKLRDPRAAMELYREALSLDPENRDILHQLVEHYSAAEMWGEALESILRIAELEPDAMRRGKYYQAAGTIGRHHVTGDRAVEYLNKALDCFFIDTPALPESLRAGCMKAFADIGRILYEAGEWKKLERNYRKMIKRLKPEDKELAELWHGLGQVYRKHLGLRESAINSFEVAAALDGKRHTNHRILIDLYAETGADKLDKAIERRFKLIEQQPTVGEHYSALRSLYMKTKQFDRVWCACRALVFLGTADTKEREFYRRRKPEGIAWPREPISEAVWGLVRHPNENPRISEIFALVSETIGYETATSSRKLGLRNDESPAFHHLRRLFGSVTYALGVRASELYIQPEAHGDIMLASLKKGKDLAPAFAIGRALYDGQSMQSIVHSFARTLTYLRPHYYLRLSLPTSAELESVFLAASGLVRSDLKVPPQLSGWVGGYASALRKRLPPSWLAQLARAVEALGREGNGHSLEEWGHAVDATARRVGLLLTADLDTVAAGIPREPLFTAGPSQEDKVADLLIHSVSDTHFELRERLGLNLR